MAMTSSPTEAHEETFGIAPHVYHRRWLILSVLALSLITVVTAVSSLNVALPTLARDLDASSSDLQWILDAYALVFAGFLLPAGALGDRFGRRGALQVGLVIFGLAALVASQSTTPDQVIATRAVMGIGAALIMPATLSIILTSFPMHERPKAIAIWAGCAGLGGALGPISSGLLLEHFSWGSVFFINIPLVVALLVLSVIVLPGAKDPGSTSSTPPGPSSPSSDSSRSSTASSRGHRMGGRARWCSARSHSPRWRSPRSSSSSCAAATRCSTPGCSR